MMQGARVQYILVLILILVVPAEAIVIRHDRPDSVHRELARDYPMVCRVGNGNGTLIAPSWVMTAAHVADALSRKGATVQFGNQIVAIAQIAIHPNYAVAGEHRDILSAAVERDTELASERLLIHYRSTGAFLAEQFD